MEERNREAGAGEAEWEEAGVAEVEAGGGVLVGEVEDVNNSNKLVQKPGKQLLQWQILPPSPLCFKEIVFPT